MHGNAVGAVLMVRRSLRQRFRLLDGLVRRRRWLSTVGRRCGARAGMLRDRGFQQRGGVRYGVSTIDLQDCSEGFQSFDHCRIVFESMRRGEFFAELVATIGHELFDVRAKSVDVGWLEVVAAIDALAQLRGTLLPAADDAHAVLFDFVHVEVQRHFAFLDDLVDLLEDVVDAFER